jgi:hypothetical protein
MGSGASGKRLRWLCLSISIVRSSVVTATCILR